MNIKISTKKTLLILILPTLIGILAISQIINKNTNEVASNQSNFLDDGIDEQESNGNLKVFENKENSNNTKCPDGYVYANAGYCKNIVCVSMRYLDQNFNRYSVGGEEIKQLDEELKRKGYRCNYVTLWGFMEYGDKMIPALEKN